MIRIACIVAAVLAVGSAAQAVNFDCQKSAARPTTIIGVYTFRQVCQSKGADAHMHSVSYPRIASKNATAAKWNALVAKMARTVFADNSPDEFDTFDISYTIGTASAKLISVHFDFYANSAGTAHPTAAQAEMNVMMPAVVALQASDLFKITPRWKTFMAKQLGDAFVKTAGISLKDGGIESGTLTSQATDPKYWFIDANGLTIETGDLVQAPNSDIEATIPWTALKPYLAANAPVP